MLMGLFRFFNILSKFVLSENTINLDMNFGQAKKIALQTPFKVILSTLESGGLKIFRKILLLPSAYYLLIEESPGGVLVSIRANKVERFISIVLSVLVCVVAGGGGVVSSLKVIQGGNIEHALIGVLMISAAALLLLWLKLVFLILRAISRVSSTMHYFQKRASLELN